MVGKILSFHKEEGWEQGVKKDPGRGDEALFVRIHSTLVLQCTINQGQCDLQWA